MNTLTRVLNAIFTLYNKWSKKRASDNPSSTIANGGDVMQSDKSFSDLASKPDSNRIE